MITFPSAAKLKFDDENFGVAVFDAPIDVEDKLGECELMTPPVVENKESAPEPVNWRAI